MTPRRANSRHFEWARRPRFDLVRLLPLALVLPGCSRDRSTEDGVHIDPAAASAAAMAKFDSNKDGAIGADEMAACPPLAAFAASYDGNSDGRLSEEEIASRLTRLYGPGSNVTNLDCTVMFNGRPLAGATLRLSPVEFFGQALPAAEGTTDAEGRVRPSVGAEDLPTEYSSESLLYPGLYYVEVTHPQMPLSAKYNTATELGCEVDPAARGGTSAYFDLKTN